MAGWIGCVWCHWCNTQRQCLRCEVAKEVQTCHSRYCICSICPRRLSVAREGQTELGETKGRTEGRRGTSFAVGKDLYCHVKLRRFVLAITRITDSRTSWFWLQLSSRAGLRVLQLTHLEVLTHVVYSTTCKSKKCQTMHTHTHTHDTLTHLHTYIHTYIFEFYCACLLSAFTCRRFDFTPSSCRGPVRLRLLSQRSKRHVSRCCSEIFRDPACSGISWISWVLTTKQLWTL